MAACVLMGLKYDRDFNARLLQGVRRMKESVTYQAILDEGRMEGRVEGRIEGLTEGELGEARRILLRTGAKRLGNPTAEAETAVNGIASREQLERLVERLFEVESWDELLGETISE